MRRMLFAAAAAGALAFWSAPSPAAPAASRSGGAWATAATLRRGVNVLGYDPLWQDASKARFKPRHFKIIRDGGFDFVRIVLQSFSHMDADNRLDRKWFATLDSMVDAATAAGLSVIIDEHDFNYCSDDPVKCQVKLGAFWGQVAPHFRARPKSVMFEILNEPHGALNGTNWNIMLKSMIPLIRASTPGSHAGHRADPLEQPGRSARPHSAQGRSQHPGHVPQLRSVPLHAPGRAVGSTT